MLCPIFLAYTYPEPSEPATAAALPPVARIMLSAINFIFSSPIISPCLTSKETSVSNAVAFELPMDFWFYVDAYVKINGSTVYQVELTTHDIVKNFAVTHDNDPYIPVAKAVLEGNNIVVYYDKHIVNSIDGLAMSYIYTPVIFTDDVLAKELEPLIDEIINRAVLIALENIEAPRTETKAQLNSLQE